jgi:hypothetical protein
MATMVTGPVPTGPGTPGGSASGGTSGITGATGATGPGGGTDVDDFFQTLESADLSIEGPISEEESNQAITLFSVVNILLGGGGTLKVGNETKSDVLGILNIYYGLQDKSLTSKIVVRSQQLWTTIQDELKALRDDLEILGPDVDFLKKEAKRQFNLGTNADVPGNAEFPKLFNRYVVITNDPLLTLDIRNEENSQFSDKEQIAKAYDLLVELKGLILQIVRSLSKNGTVATERANQLWANYENRAFQVLKKVADARISDDQDELRILSVLADLLDKDLSTRIAPYIALARDGGRLLKLAMTTYLKDKDNLDNFERSYLLDLFQNGTVDTFLTTQMRNAALVVKKYPLTTWMG